MKNEVRELRSMCGLSQAALAEALEVSRQTINAIETERYAHLTSLAVLNRRS